jgi:hypothetical protein
LFNFLERRTMVFGADVWKNAMPGISNTMRGVVHGNSIEVEGGLNLPEGQQVAITVQPLLSPEEPIRQSFGGWAEDAAELMATGRREVACRADCQSVLRPFGR